MGERYRTDVLGTELLRRDGALEGLQSCRIAGNTFHMQPADHGWIQQGGGIWFEAMFASIYHAGYECLGRHSCYIFAIGGILRPAIINATPNAVAIIFEGPYTVRCECRSPTITPDEWEELAPGEELQVSDVQIRRMEDLYSIFAVYDASEELTTRVPRTSNPRNSRPEGSVGLPMESSSHAVL